MKLKKDKIVNQGSFNPTEFENVFEGKICTN